MSIPIYSGRKAHFSFDAIILQFPCDFLNFCFPSRFISFFKRCGSDNSERPFFPQIEQVFKIYQLKASNGRLKPHYILLGL